MATGAVSLRALGTSVAAFAALLSFDPAPAAAGIIAGFSSYDTAAGHSAGCSRGEPGDAIPGTSMNIINFQPGDPSETSATGIGGGSTGFAYSSLDRGALGVSAISKGGSCPPVYPQANVVEGPGSGITSHTGADASASLGDKLTLHVSNAPALVTISYTVDGGLASTRGNQAGAGLTADILGPVVDTAGNIDELLQVNLTTDQLYRATISATFLLPVGDNQFSVSADIGVSCTADNIQPNPQNGPFQGADASVTSCSASFSSTGQFAVLLPDGVTMTSDSGVFLTSTGVVSPVPEPTTLSLLVGGLGLGLLLRRDGGALKTIAGLQGRASPQQRTPD